MVVASCSEETAGVADEGETRIGGTMVVPSCSEETPGVADGETEVLKMRGRIPVHMLGSTVLVI